MRYPLHLGAGTLSLFCAVILCVSGQAKAAVLQIDGAGQLTGAQNVNVGGVGYDVEFIEGTCISVFSGCNDAGDFTFNTKDSAIVAGEALLNQVFIDGTAGLFDTDPELTFGCDNLLECTAIIPYLLDFAASPSNPLFVILAANHSTEINDTGSSFSNTDPVIDSDTTSPDAQVFARFAPTVVPLPAAAWLFLTGLAGLGALGWSRRKAT